jgi:hypothetical protein
VPTSKFEAEVKKSVGAGLAGESDAVLEQYIKPGDA